MRLSCVVCFGACVFAPVTARATTANAPTLSMVHHPNGSHSIYIDAGALNGNVDTIYLDARPYAGATFINIASGLIAGAPRPAGQGLTYRNRRLDLDPFDPDNPGGLGWSLVGLEISSAMLAFITGPLGGLISTPAPTLEAPGLFLANVLLSGVGNGSAHVQLVRAGDVKFDATVELLPEPSSLGLAGVSMMVLSGIYRRTAPGSRRRPANSFRR